MDEYSSSPKAILAASDEAPEPRRMLGERLWTTATVVV
jgi:hypothetical protein